ncbi:MAG: hypothetical protein ABH843_06845 [Candidatus Omnitrophota bacterium]
MAKIIKKRGRKKQNNSKGAEFIRLRKWIMGLFVVFVAVILVKPSYAEEEIFWHRSDAGIDETGITAISVVRNLSKVIYAGGGRDIYKSSDSGESWQRVFMLKGEREGINFLTYDFKDTYKIYAAAVDGLYISKNNGKDWERIFKGMEDLQREVTCVAVDNENTDSIYIGTARGFFQSKDGGKHWSGQSTFVNKEISSVAIANNAVYVCAIDGVYLAKKNSDSWERIYVGGVSEEEDTYDNYDNGDSNEEKRTGELNHISILEDRIYLATDDGVLIKKETGDGGWQRLTSEGLLTKKIRSVLPLDKVVFAATDKGVFLYNKNNERWISISSGLATLDVNVLGYDAKKQLLYAACNKGLYKAELFNFEVDQKKNIAAEAKSVLKKEPTISEIQQAAISYAEVSHEKIEWMRSAAKNKAWLPKVTAGLDGDIDRAIDLDRGGTNDPDFYIVGPKEKGWGWDVSASWDLGELIWSDDQTNIDVRSRLMVQLRNDILDEVTKLYFERRRLAHELYSNPPEDKEKKALKQLRLEELTANIDALTNGYLSKRTKNI